MVCSGLKFEVEKRSKQRIRKVCSDLSDDDYFLLHKLKTAKVELCIHSAEVV